MKSIIFKIFNENIVKNIWYIIQYIFTILNISFTIVCNK